MIWRNANGRSYDFITTFEWNPNDDATPLSTLYCASIVALFYSVLSTPPAAPASPASPHIPPFHSRWCFILWPHVAPHTPLCERSSLSSPLAPKYGCWCHTVPPIPTPYKPARFSPFKSLVLFSLTPFFLSFSVSVSPSRWIGTFGVRQKYQHDTDIQLKIHPRTRRTDFGETRAFIIPFTALNTVYICVLWNILLLGNLEEKTKKNLVKSNKNRAKLAKYRWCVFASPRGHQYSRSFRARDLFYGK